jgi:prevent-host-death family protein
MAPMLIPTKQNTKTVTDLRERTIDILEASSREPLYIFHRSEPKAVILSIEKFSSLLEKLEDYKDTIDTQRLELEGYTDEELTSWKSIKEDMDR